MPYTEDFVRRLWAEEAEIVLLFTVTVDSLPAPIRACDRPGGFTSRGVFYPYRSGSFRFGGASGEQPFAPAALSIADLDPTLQIAAEAAEAEPLLTVEIVDASAPDQVQRALTNARLGELTGDVVTATATVKPRRFDTEPACKRRYTPESAPGLF